MDRSIIITRDGSHTVAIPSLNVTYHSHHGAIQESMHVFINAGLIPLISRQLPQIRILEIGFGTGLNALLSLIESDTHKQSTHYSAIELHPLLMKEAASLNYCEQIGRADLMPFFEKLHQCEWEKDIPFINHFSLKKIQSNVLDLLSPQPVNFPHFKPVHLVYYDAFAPAAQPELWTKEIFEKIYRLMLPGGLLVTYCSKADVRRAMEAAGFQVEKLVGPRGKREMVRASVPDSGEKI